MGECLFCPGVGLGVAEPTRGVPGFNRQSRPKGDQAPAGRRPDVRACCGGLPTGWEGTKAMAGRGAGKVLLNILLIGLFCPIRAC